MLTDNLLKHQEMMIKGGFQKYAYAYKDGKIESIICLVCNKTSVDVKDIKEQYCSNCKKHHLTPS